MVKAFNRKEIVIMQFVTFKMLAKTKLRKLCETHEFIENEVDSTLANVLSKYEDKLFKKTDRETYYNLTESDVFDIARAFTERINGNHELFSKVDNEPNRVTACIASYIDNEACLTTYCTR